MDERSKRLLKYGSFVTVPVGILLILGFIINADAFGLLLVMIFAWCIIIAAAGALMTALTMMAGIGIDTYLVSRRKKKIRKNVDQVRENSITIKDWEAYQKDEPPVK